MPDFLNIAGTHTPIVEIAARFVLAAVFGAVMGFDREVKNRNAGLRTHMLTSLAAAVFTVLTFEIFEQTQARSAQITADPIRVIEAVTAGVAFLAAGAIIQSRGQVHGLTTGAGMWLAGSIGVACGAGLYAVATVATIMTIIILSVLNKLGHRYLKSGQGSPERDSK